MIQSFGNTESGVSCIDTCRQVDRWIGGRGEGRGEGGWLSGTEKDRTNRI